MNMLGVAFADATDAAAGVAAVRARTGAATSELTVPTVRMAEARMLRRIRMTTSMRLPWSGAYDPAAAARQDFFVPFFLFRRSLALT